MLSPRRKPITVVSTSGNWWRINHFFILCERWIIHYNNFPMSNFDNFIDNMQKHKRNCVPIQNDHFCYVTVTIKIASFLPF